MANNSNLLSSRHLQYFIDLGNLFLLEFFILLKKIKKKIKKIKDSRMFFLKKNFFFQKFYFIEKNFFFKFFLSLNSYFSNFQNNKKSTPVISIYQGFQVFGQTNTFNFILPGCTFFEKYISNIDALGRFSGFNQLFPRLANTKRDTDIGFIYVFNLLNIILSNFNFTNETLLPIFSRRNLLNIRNDITVSQVTKPLNLEKLFNVIPFLTTSLFFSSFLDNSLADFYSDTECLEFSKTCMQLKQEYYRKHSL